MSGNAMLRDCSFSEERKKEGVNYLIKYNVLAIEVTWADGNKEYHNYLEMEGIPSSSTNHKTDGFIGIALDLIGFGISKYTGIPNSWVFKDTPKNVNDIRADEILKVVNKLKSNGYKCNSDQIYLFMERRIDRLLFSL